MQFQEQTFIEPDSFNILDESPESSQFLEADLEEGTESSGAPEESIYTDDPVRVYLREMGSVRLLTRQGEIDLAKRMERGKRRVRKVLSRSPLVQQTVMAIYADLSHGKLDLEDLTEVGAKD